MAQAPTAHQGLCLEPSSRAADECPSSPCPDARNQERGVQGAGPVTLRWTISRTIRGPGVIAGVRLHLKVSEGRPKRSAQCVGRTRSDLLASEMEGGTTSRGKRPEKLETGPLWRRIHPGASTKKAR